VITQNAAEHKAAEGQYAEDIAKNGAGVPVVAAYDGTVVSSFLNLPGGTCTVAGNTYPAGYGNVVVIKHDQGTTTYYTLYGHLSSRSVSAGDQVTQGQQIGVMGSTGCSTGQHVHFEIGTAISGGLITHASSLWNATDPADGTQISQGTPTGGTYPGLGSGGGGPSAPSSLTVTTDQENSATLKWSTSSGGVGGVAAYKIVRNGSVVASVSAGTASYLDTTISPGVQYAYWIVAVDTAGNDSTPSPAVTTNLDQKGQGSFELSSRYGATYCRQVGSGPNNQHSYLQCTVFNGTTWTDHTSGLEDWGYTIGWAWVSDHGNPTYCRQVGSGPNNQHSYLQCTVFNGTTWTDHTSGLEDWGYAMQLTWLSSASPLQRPHLSSSHAVRGRRFTATLRESGGAAPFVWARTSGSLPRGLILRRVGVISGTPRVAGSFRVRVKVQDIAGQEASVAITIRVAR
jgi:hypothetical protein